MIFQSVGMGWGNDYATFQYIVTEVPLYSSDVGPLSAQGTVTVNVAFQPSLPVLSGSATLNLTEDTPSAEFNIDALDLTGVLVYAHLPWC